MPNLLSKFRKKKEVPPPNPIIEQLEANILSRASYEMTPEQESDVVKKLEQLKRLKEPYKPETVYEKKVRWNWNEAFKTSVGGIVMVVIALIGAYREETVGLMSKVWTMGQNCLNKIKFW